jgi:pyruvate formate lyase activating enzyme
MTATIFEIKRFAVHDGDGIRTTVFFKGCPLRCVWCHNPEGISKNAQVARYSHKCISCGECKKDGFVPEDCIGESYVLYGKEMTVGELMPLLLEDKEFYENSGGGVTLSGGECLIYADFCADLLKRLKKEGIHTAVDTSGFVSKEALDKVIPYTDIFLYDIKAFDPIKHKEWTGVRNELILSNLKKLLRIGVKIWVRIPVIASINDSAEEMLKIREFFDKYGSPEKVELLPYHSLGEGKYEACGMTASNFNAPTYETLNELKAIFD